MNSSFDMFDILQIRSIEQAHRNVHHHDQLDFDILNDILAVQNNTQQETNIEQNNQFDMQVLKNIDLDITFNSTILLAQPEQNEKQEENPGQEKKEQQQQQFNEINAYIELMDLHYKHMTEMRITHNAQLLIYKKQHKRNEYFLLTVSYSIRNARVHSTFIFNTKALQKIIHTFT
jgi:hypothetical protein